MAASDAAHTDDGTPSPRWRRLLRRALQALGGLLALVVALLLVVLLLLQTNWGGRTAARLIAQQANPFTNATIHVGEVGGNWLQTLELRDVALVPTADAAPADRFVHVDTLRLRYHLPALLRNTLHVREVTVAGPSATLHQRADSTWILPETAPSSAEPDTTPSTFALRIDRVRLARGAASASFYAPARDSTLRVTDVRLGARDVRYDSTLTAQLDTLGVDARLPGTEAPWHLQTAATLTADRFTLGGLRLTSPHSRVRGAGTLRLPQAAVDTFDDVDFTLTAAPLAFRDVAPFVPGVGLDPEADLQLDVRARGSGRALELFADARLSTGGTFTLEATATPSLPGDVETTLPEPLHYRVDAQARGLGTDILTPEAAAPTRVNADVQADLEGRALNQLSGTVALHLFDAQVTGYAVHTTRVQADVANGRATLDGAGDFAGAAFAVGGTVEPFAAPPTYDLRTRLSDLNVGAFVEGTEPQSALNAVLQLTGEGFDPASARLTARLDLLPSTLNDSRIDAGRLTLRYADETMRYEADLGLAGGRLAATGQAQLTAPLRYSVERGTFESLPVAAFVGDTTSSALTGSFHLDGRDLAPETMVLDAELTLRDTHYGDYVLHTATTRAALRQGRLDVDVNADVRGGQFELAAQARPFAEPLTLRTTRGRFRAVDVGALVQDTTQHSDLNGTFQLQGRGTDPQHSTWTAQVTLDSSRVNEQPLTAARFDVALEQARLDFAAQLDAPSGRTRLVGRARPFDDEPTYALTEGTLDGLDLGALAGIPSARTDLNGALTLEGRGVDLATMSLDLQLDLAASTVNSARLERGGLQARIADGEGAFDGRFDLAQGRMTVQGTTRPQGERPTYRLRGRIDDVNAAALAGIDTLQTHVSLGFALDGEGLDPETLRLTGRLTSRDTRYAALRLDTLDVQMQMYDGVLQIDTLRAQSNVATAWGGGQIALFDSDGEHTSDFLVEARASDLAPLRTLTDVRPLSLGEGEFEGRVYGRPGTLRFDASTTLTDLTYGDVRVADVEAQVAGARGDTTALSVLETRGRLGFLSYTTFTVEDTRFNARYDAGQVDFTSSLTIDRERNARLAGTADLRPGRERVVLQTFDMRLGPDRWSLLQDATIAYSDAYRVNNLLLFTDQQQIAADGVIDFDGPQSLIVTLENVEVGAITDLLGYEGLGGRLSGTLDMSGAAENPQISSALNLAVRSYDEAVGQLRLQAQYDSLRVEVDARLAHVDGSTLSLQGRVPADLRLAAADTADVMNDPVHLSLSADDFSIGWVRPFLDPETIGDVSGQLAASATIGGTLAAPELDGSGSLRDGRLEMEALSTTYDRIRADLDFTGGAVTVREASARSAGGGRLRAQGTINLTELTLGAYDLSVTTTDFLAIDTREYRMRVDSDLEVSGTTQRPVVRGSAQVESADVYFEASAGGEADLMGVELSPADQQIVERRFGIRLTEADTTTFDAYEAMALDVSVRFQRDTWLRSRSNPRMDIQFTGDLDVQKEHAADAQVFGTIEVIPERSRVVQFGREFLIDEGTLSFNGPATEPAMDIRAVYRVRARGETQENEAEIILSITGSPEDLDLDLSSDPLMETSDILCYVAMNRPCGGSHPTDANGDPSLGEQLAFGSAAGIVENLAASQLGLDVVRIEPQTRGTISLTAGQYLSPRFYAAIEQTISNGDVDANANTSNVPNITLEYELTRWLLLRTRYRNPDLRLNLLWEYAY